MNSLSLLLRLTAEESARLAQCALDISIAIEPLFNPSTDERAKDLAATIPQICTLYGQIKNHSTNDAEAVRLMQKIRLAHLKLIELAIRFAYEPESDSILDTVADEVMLVNQSLVARTDIEVTSATKVTEELVWKTPWPRSTGNSEIRKWKHTLGLAVSRTAHNRPLVQYATAALASFSSYYMED